MSLVKAAVYIPTIVGLLFSGFAEMRLKRELLDRFRRLPEHPSDFGILNDLSTRLRNEQQLKDVPERERSKFRFIVLLKFALLAALIIEVVILQR